MNNDIYDCIVVGAGPAGSVAAYLLAKEGYKVLILEKSHFKSEKICGGWVPHWCMTEFVKLGIPIYDFCKDNANFVTGYHIIKENNEKFYSCCDGNYGMGCFRQKLDTYLIDVAINVGAQIRYNQVVTKILRTQNHYNVNGFYANKVILAPGTISSLSNIATFKEKLTIGMSAIIKAQLGLNSKEVYLWYENEKRLDHFWAIPVAKEIWNVGYFTPYGKHDVKQKYQYLYNKYISSRCDTIDYIYRPRGTYLGNVNQTHMVKNAEYAIGDFAGYNNARTGEGIYSAILSAKQEVDRILNGV